MLRCLLLAVTLVACSGPSGHGPIEEDASVVQTEWVNVEEARPAIDPIPPADECVVTTAEETPVGAAHVAPCTNLDYPQSPPSTGTHYSQWADFRTYDEPVPYGYIVHALEHGGVALIHNCGSDCENILGVFDSVIASQGEDRRCEGADIPSRFIIMPDPTLDVPIAAVAWGHVYRATCLDQDSLQAWVEEHYGNGPEDLCARGVNNADSGWCLE